MLLQTLKSKEQQKVNSTIDVQVKVFDEPKSPYISLTLLDDSILSFDDITTVSVSKICEMLEVPSVELAAKGYVSEYSNSMVVDIDNGDD